MRRVFGEPGSRRRAGWDLAGSVAILAVFAWIAVPETPWPYGAWDRFVALLLVPAIFVNGRHALRAMARLRGSHA